MALFSIQDICKSYPGVQAAQNVSFEIDEGEIVGFLGKNGAGKSTIIRILAGVEQPDSGTISMYEAPCTFTMAKQAADAGIAVVHQELNDVPLLTVAENMAMGLGYPKKAGILDRRALNARARAALAELHMDVDPNALVGELSVAERRMVMIARALLTDAKLIVLDEPTASLTEREIEELFAVIKRLKSQDVSFLYVSHRLKEITELCDRSLVMRDGHLVADVQMKDIDEDALVALIAGKRKKSLTSKRAERTFGDEVLRVEGLDPFYRGTPFDLHVAAGEILGLAGLGGAGRTETIRQILGANPNLGVTCTLNGRNVQITSPKQAWDCGIGLVPEDRRNEGALLNFPITHNITLSSLKLRRSRNWLPFPSTGKEAREAEHQITTLNLKTPSAEESLANLSGGNQQKAILARSLSAGCKVLILDEPTHGVDVDAKTEIYSQIMRLAASGCAIILISSELPELIELADRFMVLSEGKLVASLNGEVSENELLKLCLTANAEMVA